jgi:GT2 family glycosyltransferase
VTQADLSVLVPTIGRPRQLRTCLQSLTACVPGPSEILVVDQSATTAIEEIVREFTRFGAHRIGCEALGVAHATNLGLNSAGHELVAITHDDCTVSVDWIGTALNLMARDPTAIYTGSVLPFGDPLAVPSTIDDPRPRDYTGHLACRVLYPNNMICGRSGVLALGGFDPRVLAAEDNDFCYRWLRSGHRLLYVPSLRVWHHDWRSPEELRKLYRNYGRSQGIFFAKHLRQGDLRMLRFISEDVLGVARATVSAAVRRHPKQALVSWRMLRGLPAGLRQGWREFAPRPEVTT